MISAEKLAGMAGSRSGRFPPSQTNAGFGGRTAYQVLQVDPDAEQEVIEAAFKRLALKYHPDKSTAPDASDRMRELIESHGLLTDPSKKELYDASIGIRRKPKLPRAMRASDV
jgi:DnaJ-class molecular chaperone